MIDAHDVLITLLGIFVFLVISISGVIVGADFRPKKLELVWVVCWISLVAFACFCVIRLTAFFVFQG